MEILEKMTPLLQLEIGLNKNECGQIEYLGHNEGVGCLKPPLWDK